MHENLLCPRERMRKEKCCCVGFTHRECGGDPDRLLVWTGTRKYQNDYYRSLYKSQKEATFLFLLAGFRIVSTSESNPFELCIFFRRYKVDVVIFGDVEENGCVRLHANS